MKVSLKTPISQLPRITPKYTKRFKKLGIETVRDLLFHFPHRYDDFTNIISISNLELNKTATIRGEILDIKNIRTFRKKMTITQAIVGDKTGNVKVVWFNQPFLLRNLKKGNTVSLSGKLTLGADSPCFSSPSHETVRPQKEPTHTARLVPVYPETEGISSRFLRYYIKSILLLAEALKEFLPEEIIKSQNLLPLKTALEEIHFPKNKNLAEKARKRFSFSELFLIQLNALKQKKDRQKEKGISIPFNKEIVQKFVKTLPFNLTNAQRKSTWQILQDLEKSEPMNRLLDGDVGSGKTMVAVIAALGAVKNGHQVAFMAPTEILAEQHFATLVDLLKDFDINIGLLTSSENKLFCKNQADSIPKKGFFSAVANGEINILIGTHALISASRRRDLARLAAGQATGGQKTVKFKNLALVIVDEQHRFGVEQRAKLIKEGKTAPHLLSMSATPIPRTLALTLYGELDISILDEMPKGRQKIITKIIAPANREEAYQFIRNQIKQGRQVFVICPRIEKKEESNESNKKGQGFFSWADVKAVKEEYEKLSKNIFPDLKIAMLHGRLKSKEKEEIMKDFAQGKLDMIVSTSVIEVGIDVPNATVMMIEGAERFGLAQLYQFRGRVGRGKHQSYCFLFTESPAKNTRARLKALLTAKNGFELAEKDLEIRGPGELYGIHQSGLPDLAMASLKDLPLIESARKEADLLLEKDLKLKNYPLLSEKLKEFQRMIHFE